MVGGITAWLVIPLQGVTLPNVVGESQERAESILKSTGLTARIIRKEQTEASPPGYRLETRAFCRGTRQEGWTGRFGGGDQTRVG
jgi:hypothetical protein